MRNRYTFTGHDFEGILQNANLLMPGIRKVIAIFKPSSEGELNSIIRNKPDSSEEIEPLNLVDTADRIQELRKLNKRYDWFAEHELGLEKKAKNISKAEIFDELEKNVLLLRFKSDFDKNSDLLLIYLNTNKGNYGLSRSDEAIESVQKSVIEFHLFNALNAFILTNQKNRQIQQRVNQNTQALVHENQKLREDLEVSKTSIRKSLKNLAQQYCKEISRENKKNYLLTERAISKIESFNGNINDLYSIVENAIVYAENISLIETSDIFYLDAWHFNLDHYSVNETPELITKIFNEQKYESTIALLNRLESGAKLTLNQNKKLTAANVGLLCSKPMQAPGITDALKNHKSKILTLFQKYPNKWVLIRKEFKPIRNLIISSQKRDQLSA